MTVSVLTASYNYAQYIGDAIESVLAQTYTDWEMIIVDDGSRDNSLEIIRKYADLDSRIKVFTHPDGKNHGLAATLQLGLEKAQGEWIAFLESDDQFTPTSLEEKIAVVQQHPEVVLVFTDVEMFGEKGYEKVLNKFYNANSSLNYPCKIGSRFCFRNYILSFSTVLVAKKDILKCDFDTPVKPWLDYYLWTQLSTDFMFYLNRPLTRWRWHADSYNQEMKISSLEKFHFSNRIVKFGCTKSGWKKILLYLKNVFYFHRIFIRIHLFRKEIVIFGKVFRW